MFDMVYINNFKAFPNKTNIWLSNNAVIIGDNDSGKSTILQALDIFFNWDTVPKEYVVDLSKDVEIGVLINKSGKKAFIKKIFKSKTFKLSAIDGDTSLLSGIIYIYISPEISDVKKLISTLASAKALETMSKVTMDSLFNNANKAVNEILDRINKNMLIMNGGATSLTSSINIKLEQAFKYDITSSGIPLEGRGSGYKKSVTYALLSGDRYSNTIIGIDEIENSLSLNHAKELIDQLKIKFLQTLVTTHSSAIISKVDSSDVYPILKGDISSPAELLAQLGTVGDETFLLVEGKNDMVWMKKILSLLGVSDKYIVIQCGGCGSIKHVYSELVSKGKQVNYIVDGDTNEPNHALSKLCIEFYTPINTFNSLFSTSLSTYPATKTDLFNIVTTATGYTDDTIKSMIADNVDSFLDLSNPLTNEVKSILGIS